MNYKLIYENFIESRKNINLDNEYYESHHILPKSLGGKNDKINLIKLSARDHYFAHLLLSKFGGPKMVIALTYFANKNNRYNGGVRYKPNSRKISILRENANKARKILLSGRKFSESHKLNLSKSKIGIPAHNKGKNRSIESNKKQSKSMIGKSPWNKGLIGDEYKNRYKNGKLTIPNLTGYKWINDGTKQTKLPPNQILPTNWIYGRIDNRGDNNPMRKMK